MKGVWFARFVSRLRWRLSFVCSEHLSVGVRHHALLEPGNSLKVKRALDLLAHAVPSKFSTLAGCLPGGIAVELADYANGWFDSDQKACVLGAEFVEASDAIDIAFTVMHELSHARLEHFGFSYDEGTRLRIERLCVSQEIFLASRLLRDGHCPPATVDALRRKRDGLCQEQFSDRALTALRRKEILQRAQVLGTRVPWFIRLLLLRATKRRLRRLRRP